MFPTHVNLSWRRPASRGFSILEALVALVIVSFGMLAIAGFQATMSFGSDVAKQRMEAVRLAQDKMEQFRAFANMAGYSTIASGSDGPFVSNASFNRSWTVTQGPNDTERWVSVAVQWTDRRGQTQQVAAQSAISKFDPKDIGTLATGPGGVQVRKPKNRNINIPYPAVTLSGGSRSAFIPPPGNVIYVFDNVTGKIVQSCEPQPVTVSLTGTGTTALAAATGHNFSVGSRVNVAGASVANFNGTFTVGSAVPSVSFGYTLSTALATPVATGVSATATLVFNGLTEGIDLSTVGGLTCTDFTTTPKYLLSGYIRFDTGNNPTGAIPSSPGSNNATLPLNASTPFALDSTNNPSGTQPTMICYSQRQMVLEASSSTPLSITGISINTSTGVVTVTTGGHPFVTGQWVAINGFVNTNVANSTSLLGAFVVTVQSTTQFTYQIPTPYPSSASITSGTARLLPRITVPEGTTATGYGTSPVERFISYACVVTPVDHDTNTSTPARWWGRVDLQTDGSWQIWTSGNTSGLYKVCRYSADYNGNTVISNSEHPLWYRAVTDALDGQSYLVIAASQNCPTDKPQDLLGNPVNFSDDTTAAHQPTGELSFQMVCNNAQCNSVTKTTRENATTSADIPMD